ncbi:MAG TPA: hypothetical protein VFG21_00260 [Xanthomonadaceae bacterium]|nr:hypothetical protein [Xanthomonadaceae bacterium]
MEHWWITRVGDCLVWARLAVREAGTAEVLDASGLRLSYDSEDSARAALMEADFLAVDGLDEDDAARLGTRLAELAPPRADDEAALVRGMSQPVPQRH